MTALLAAGCVALAVALLHPPTGAGARHLSGRPVVAAALGAGGTTALAVGGLADARAVVLGMIIATTAYAALRWHRSRTAVARAERERDRVAEFCEALAAELGTGLPPVVAVERTTAEFADLAPVAVAARLDADVPHTLRGLAERPGWEDLRLLAATWQVARRSGAALAPALESLAGSVRHRRGVARVVAAELAGAYATARLMAGLPALMLLLGSSLGGDPTAFLLRTWPGLVCLTLGLLCLAAGMAWLTRIERAVATG